ncbi:MAG: DNA-binding response regulator [Firmicutes bacterium HGW-Firmicutes-1]|jgi:DNA-binding response OmpR family regulator|nr:MAG: DNA-binding response regulator [Firmicutes bacterium HGW-Firmicutes-1]
MDFKSKILIVDDDENITELISLYLIKEGYDTKIVHSGSLALSTFQAYSPNLVILDLMLPGKDGYDVCKEIRQISNVPIIMLTAKGETFDKILGLELGADDYMVKPFDTKELTARVKAVLRRFTPQKDKSKQIILENLNINLTNYSVMFKDTKIEMPPKELELLYFLASSPNQVFTREQLLNRIWGYEYLGDTRTVDVHIKRIREKINENDYWAIKTVWGIGYKFEVK